MSSKQQTCRVCQSSAPHKNFTFREMMIGFREEFDYFQCSDCKCLQINEVPENLPKYYGEGYYSYRSNPSAIFEKPGISIIAKIMFSFALKGKSILEYTLAPEKLLGFWTKIMAVGEAGATKNSKILDVGCGSGSVLYLLDFLGFKNLKGVDPFIDKDMTIRNGVTIHKQELTDHKETGYDLIMFHHSFEHLTNPSEIMGTVKKLLSPKGVCAIRIPTSSTDLLDIFGGDWIEIDAPRHIFLHSKESMEIMAKRNGLKIDKIIYDSTSLQFWGSKLYEKNISLHEFNQSGKKLSDYFSSSELASFRKECIRLNNERKGGRFAVYLSHA